MKNLLILTLLLLIPCSFALEQNFGDIQTDYNSLHVAAQKYEPYPASPGKYFDLWIKIENTGPEKTDVNFKLTPKYPFSLDGNEEAERTVDGLEGGSTALLHYTVRVAINAVEGSNALHYEYRMKGNIQSSSLDIWVQTMDANIAVNAVSVQQLVPGQATPVEISLENLGDSPLTDVNVKLDMVTTNMPFVPINSTTEQKLYFIEPHRKNSVVFNLMPLPNAAASAYKVPIEIKYVDGTGKNYTRTSIIGLVVESNPDILITVSQANLVKNAGTVSLKITNRGLSDLKLITAKLIETKDYSVLADDEIYLGNIDSDDYQTAEYTVKINKITNNTVPMKLQLDYLDANNKKFSETKDVLLKMSSNINTTSNNSTGTILFVLIFIVAGYFLYRKWEKGKLAKK